MICVFRPSFEVVKEAGILGDS